MELTCLLFTRFIGDEYVVQMPRNIWWTCQHTWRASMWRYSEWQRWNVCWYVICSAIDGVHCKKNGLLLFELGDSGGPLNCRTHKNGPWILAGMMIFSIFLPIFIEEYFRFLGITSFGSGCSDNGYNPDVYIRISHYIKWIAQTISQN